MVQFPVLQDLYKTFNDGKSLCRLSLVRCANLEIPIRLEFVRTLTERLPQAFTKLQLGFALCCITIRETLLADVIDCRQDFLKLVDSVRNLFDEGGFRAGPLMFRSACSCHSCVKSLAEGWIPGKKTTGFDEWAHFDKTPKCASPTVFDRVGGITA
jgi:hypothetical protein